MGIALIVLISLICATIIITSLGGGIVFDSVPFGVRVECEEELHCPHAMLIRPIDNSIVNNRDVELTLYIYDNDDSVWFLNVTFIDNDTGDNISSLTSKSDWNISCIWTNLTPGQSYEWYGYLVNSSGGNYTTGVFSFTVGQSIVGTASDFYGTWILLGIIIMLIVITLVMRSQILGIFTLIVTVLMTTFYYNSIMDSASGFDTMLGWVFMALVFFVLVELMYLGFYRGKG